MKTDNEFQLFEKNDNGFIELIYPPNNGMSAKDVGEAILGMQLCLAEIARVSGINNIEIIVYPIEKGSLKTIFAYVKKDGWKIVVGIDIVFNLINNGFGVIENFGANKAHNLTTEVIQSVKDLKVLELCKSKNFIYGGQKIVQPLKENIQSVKIQYGKDNFEIECENKQKFYEDLIIEPIFPELENGKEITIVGEITRMNKGYGDLGFQYKNRTLKCVPWDIRTSVTQYHEYIEENQVQLKGIVSRSSIFDVPEISIISIQRIEPNQSTLFEEGK
ncbi:hypothetical protein JW758_04710 [Candidatus Peregrinibacteria bacterium]|nr:hypothetical protein [Candidatus Peregrinibacteria bacterium]